MKKAGQNRQGLMKKSCVYRIRNVIDGKCYYGSSINYLVRWRVHKTDLRMKKHGNERLQNAWSKYGEESFVFEIVEEVFDKSLLTVREQHYFDNEKCEYNISKMAAGGNLGEEVNRKISIASKGSRNVNFGKVLPNEVKQKLSKANGGINNPMYGRKHSKETLAKMSESQRRRQNGAISVEVLHG